MQSPLAIQPNKKRSSDILSTLDTVVTVTLILVIAIAQIKYICGVQWI